MKPTLLVAGCALALVLLSPSEAVTGAGTSPVNSNEGIYEWGDDTGTRHFTNSLRLLPERARSDARVFVEQRATSTTDDETATTEHPAPEEEEEAAAKQSGSEALAESFGVGWTLGWHAGFGRQQPVRPAGLPAVVLEIPPPVLVNVPPYDPSGLYYRSPYQGTMSVPFDGGRSRGLTHRQHLQEQRRLDRERLHGWR